MDPILSHILAAVAGALAGAGLVYLTLTRGHGKGSAAAVRAEFDQYKEQVADHFSRTASAVNQLTDSYKTVFDELQEGASQLMDEDTLRQRLAHDDGEAITLSRLGYSAHPASGLNASQNASQDASQDAGQDAGPEAAASPATADAQPADATEPARDNADVTEPEAPQSPGDAPAASGPGGEAIAGDDSAAADEPADGEAGKSIDAGSEPTTAESDDEPGDKAESGAAKP